MNFITSPTNNCHTTFDEPKTGHFKKNHIQLNRSEEIVYKQLWSFVDSENQNKIQGIAAAKFLRRSGLNESVLHEIWRLSDTNNKGYLCFQDFCACCRLISHVQQGYDATVECISQEPCVLPSFDLPENGTDSIKNDNANVPTILNKTSGFPRNKQFMQHQSDYPTKNIHARHQTNFTTDSSPALYAISKKEILKYQKIFYSLKLDSTYHLLGEEAKNIMTRSSLPNNTLLKIWDLVDRNQNGKLTEKEFIVAMHLISLSRNNIPVPHEIPEELLFLLEKKNDDNNVESPKNLNSKNVKPKIPRNKDSETFSYSSWNNKEDTKLHDENKHAHTLTAYNNCNFKRNIQKYVLCRDIDQEKTNNTHLPQLFHSMDTKEQEMIRYIVQCLDTFGEELKNFKGIEKTLRWKLVVESKSLKEHLTHRLRFQQNAELLKKNLYDLLEQLHQVDTQMVIAKEDINHYQNDILFLKNVINLIQKDLKNLRSMQQIKKNQLENTQKHNILLEQNYTNVTQLVVKEEKILENQKIEIQQLLEKFHLLKEEKQQASCYDNILQEKCNQAKKKTVQLYQATQEEQLKLDNIRLNQLQNVYHKMNLSIYSEYKPLQSHNTRVSSETAQLLRDHKGVPAKAFLPLHTAEFKKLNHNLLSPLRQQPCLSSSEQVFKNPIEKNISVKTKETEFTSLRHWLGDDTTLAYQQGSIPSDVTTGHDSVQFVRNKDEQFIFDDSADLFPFQSKALHPLSNPSPTCMASQRKDNLTTKLGVQIENDATGEALANIPLS